MSHSQSNAPSPEDVRAPAPEPKPEGRGRHWTFLFGALGPFVGLALVVAFFGTADALQDGGGEFLSSGNLRRVSTQTATIAVAALGMTVIIIAGGIDLSAGTALALCATVLAWSLKEDVALVVVKGENVARAQSRLDAAVRELERAERGAPSGAREGADPETLRRDVSRLTENLQAVTTASARWTRFTPWLAVTLAVGTGCLAGLLNGTVISTLCVVPFIVTLGTMSLYLGLAKLIAAETTVRPDRAAQVPEWLTTFLSARPHALWWGLPAGVWLALAMAAALAAVLRYTVYGRHVFALGSNEATARLCGINVWRTKLAVYALAGFFIGVAGLYQFSRLTVGNPTSGSGMELDIIAAVVIGGGSLSGGRGSVPGTLAGAGIIQVIRSGCTQLGLSNPIQDVILGVIIVTAVAIDQVRQRRLAG